MLAKGDPADVQEQVKLSGLRGRGGAGFPAAQKWSFLPPDSFPRYLVVNGDEGEPCTFKDRMLVELDPHQLVEGIAISAYAIQCNLAFVYLRGEFALGHERLTQAIADAKAQGLPRHRTSSGPVSTSISSCTAAPAHTSAARRPRCSSRSKASAACRASARRSPRSQGLYAKPTVMNNVETLSTLPHIMTMGGEEYGKLGVNRSTGTRIFSVSGHVEQPGNYEVELGMTFRDLIYDIAGGIPGGRSIKFFIPGGASSQWLTGSDEHLDAPLDMDFVQQTYGVMLGSGAVMVFDETVDPLLVAWRLAEVLRARVVREVHAVPRGNGLGREGAVPHVARPRPARRPRPAVRRGRQHLARRDERAVRADDDLPARSLGRQPDRQPAQVLPRRDRGARYPAGVRHGVTTTEPEQDVQKDTVTVTVDGVTFEAQPGELLIKAAQEHGIYIPRFCWHERMKPVGMCRMCLVEIDGVRGLPPACTTPVAEGMVCHTETDTVKQVQDGVLEFLLINHPLDCPVCDRGGECPLQDQTLSFGPGESRFVEEKRHFEKPIPLSDLVLLDRERCIQCGRCTRFADEIAGDPLIDFVERGDRMQVLNFVDEPFDSYFSGNTVQICPVGALTASQYRFKARPWDLETVETSCNDVRGAVPRRVAVVVEPARPLARRRLRAGQPRLAVRQGSLRHRVDPLANSACSSRTAASTVSCARCRGRRRSTRPPRSSAPPSSSTAPSRSRCSAARAAPTRTPTRSRG